MWDAQSYVSMNAVAREAVLAAQHIAIGATALGRASYDLPAMFPQAFFALSVGVERSAKLAIALDHAVRHGRFPADQHFRQYGHDLRLLLDVVAEIAQRTQIELPYGSLPDTEIHRAIIATLTEFADNVTRYYNLQVLAAGAEPLGLQEPTAAWHARVTMAVLERHYKEARRRRDEDEAALLGELLGPYSVVHHIDETGAELRSVEGAALAKLKTNAARPWERMYVLQLGRFLGGVVVELGSLAEVCGVPVPALVEIYGLFGQEDSYLRRRKTWTIY
jgi:hypothetical protein